MPQYIYKGLSTQQYGYDKSFSLTNIECVKRDLLNHIFTRRGERIKMYNFNTRIPDLLFEPLDDNTIDIIRTDLEKVFNYDPRVNLLNLVLTPDYDSQQIVVDAVLKYIELDLTDVLSLNLEFQN